MSESVSGQTQTSEEKFTAEKIATWIKDLEAPQFLVREHAKSQLRAAGEAAYSQLYRARQVEDLEARLTIQELLSTIKIQWIGPNDSKAVVNLMLDFHSRKPKDRIAIINSLAWMPMNEAWQPLYRIAVFDKSDNVSNHSAATLLRGCFELTSQPQFSNCVRL